MTYRPAVREHTHPIHVLTRTLFRPLAYRYSPAPAVCSDHFPTDVTRLLYRIQASLHFTAILFSFSLRAIEPGDVIIRKLETIYCDESISAGSAYSSGSNQNGAVGESRSEVSRKC